MSTAACSSSAPLSAPALVALISQHFGLLGRLRLLRGADTVMAVAGGGYAALPGSSAHALITVPCMDAAGADGLSRRLAGVAGVREALVLASEGVAYLKVDSARFDEQSVLKLIAGET